MIHNNNSDALLDQLKQEAIKRLEEYQKLKEKTIKEFLDIRKEINVKLDGIEKNFNQILSQIEENDILISFHSEIIQKGNQIIPNRKREIISQLQNQIEQKSNGNSQFKQNIEKDKIQTTIKGMMTKLKQNIIEILLNLNKDQCQTIEPSLTKKVKLDPQVQLTQNKQIIQQIDISKINFELVHSLKGHSSSIQAVAISYDEMYIASGTTNNEVFLWNFQTNVLKKQYKGPQCIYSLSFSKNNLRLAAAGGYWSHLLKGGYHILIYDIGDFSKNDPIQMLQGHGSNIYRNIFTKDSKNLISCSNDCTVKVWNLAGQNESTKFSCQSCVYGLCFSENEELIGCCCSDGLAFLLNSKSLEELKNQVKWQAHKSESDCIEFIKNSTIILTSSTTEIRLWRVQDILLQKAIFMKEIQTQGSDANIWLVKAFPVSDPKLLVASQSDIKIWQMEPTQMIQSIGKQQKTKIPFATKFAISLDFKTMVTSTNDKQLDIFKNKGM